MEQEAEAKALVGGQSGIDHLGKGDRVVVGPLQVRPRARVLGLHHQGEGRDHILVGGFKRGAAATLHLVELVELTGEHKQLPLGRFELVKMLRDRIHGRAHHLGRAAARRR